MSNFYTYSSIRLFFICAVLHLGGLADSTGSLKYPTQEVSDLALPTTLHADVFESQIDMRRRLLIKDIPNAEIEKIIEQDSEEQSVKDQSVSDRDAEIRRLVKEQAQKQVRKVAQQEARRVARRQVRKERSKMKVDLLKEKHERQKRRESRRKRRARRKARHRLRSINRRKRRASRRRKRELAAAQRRKYSKEKNRQIIKTLRSVRKSVGRSRRRRRPVRRPRSRRQPTRMGPKPERQSRSSVMAKTMTEDSAEEDNKVESNDVNEAQVGRLFNPDAFLNSDSSEVQQLLSLSSDSSSDDSSSDSSLSSSDSSSFSSMDSDEVLKRLLNYFNIEDNSDSDSDV